MNENGLDYFIEGENFLEVIFLSESNHSFETLLDICENIPKAWFELSKLRKEDRIDFSCDFVLKTLPYVPKVYPIIFDFFKRLEDIDVVLTKSKNSEIFRSQIVYSLKDEDVFYKGFPPADFGDIDIINFEFNNMLPKDYLSFAKIHSGFSKNDDSGLFKIEELKNVYVEFQKILQSLDERPKADNSFIDPNSLIPFYQCYNKNDFQCFLSDWAPNGSLGNVYYSGADNVVSNYILKKDDSSLMSFNSFLEWLVFYLDRGDIYDI